MQGTGQKNPLSAYAPFVKLLDDKFRAFAADAVQGSFHGGKPALNATAEFTVIKTGNSNILSNDKPAFPGPFAHSQRHDVIKHKNRRNIRLEQPVR
jgi:hypothetical protein